MKKLIVGALLLGCIVSANPSAHAEYITAFEDIHYEKYVVDTSSLYFPDKDHKMKQFNVVVWSYTSDNDKGKSYTFSYKFEGNTWKLGEKDKKDGKIYWEKFDDNSPASNILAVVLPYINKK